MGRHIFTLVRRLCQSICDFFGGVAYFSAIFRCSDRAYVQTDSEVSHLHRFSEIVRQQCESSVAEGFRIVTETGEPPRSLTADELSLTTQSEESFVILPLFFWCIFPAVFFFAPLELLTFSRISIYHF